MAKNLTNEVTRGSNFAVIWTPLSGTAITLDRGSISLPGVDEAETYDYTTDEYKYKEVSQNAGYTNISLTTILSDDPNAGYSTWLGWAKEAKDGTLYFKPKTGAPSGCTLSCGFNVTCNSVSEVTIEEGSIPTIQIGFAVKSMI